MKLSTRELRLSLKHPFGIARGTITAQHSLIVTLRHGDLQGWGEVTANEYYGHTVDAMADAIDRWQPLVTGYGDRLGEDDWVEQLWQDARTQQPDQVFALSALDMAANDLDARRRDVPIHRRWGLEWTSVPPSSFTIGIDTVDAMANKLREQPGWPIYKIKLGTTRDLEIVRSLRRHTDAVFRVDANCGWTVNQTIELSAALADLNVQFIEQPLPVEAGDDDKCRVKVESALPIIADEDCCGEDDVQRCAAWYHGINVKLCKCGGLTPAVRMLRHAERIGLRKMVGCMVESSIGISATAQLLPLLDFADLDGACLLSDDPAVGVRISAGHVTLADGHGHGGLLIG